MVTKRPACVSSDRSSFRSLQRNLILEASLAQGTVKFGPEIGPIPHH